MLFGGNSGSCGGCGCKSCQECTRTCTEPHTGDPFEVHYTLFFEGVEAGNPGNGIATGDVDTSDPYDGMDGTGPWEQTVSYTFDIQPGVGDRYPCAIHLSFWRSSFVLGAATIPPPSQDLTVNKITVTNVSPQSAGNIKVGLATIRPGEKYEISGHIPLVAGAGDQSTKDPRSGVGHVWFEPECGNERVYVTVTATIEWNVKKRQHVLYGLVRECYDDGPSFCNNCTGFYSTPETIYLELSNITVANLQASGLSDTALQQRMNTAYNQIETTIALTRQPGGCNWYTALFDGVHTGDDDVSMFPFFCQFYVVVSENIIQVAASINAWTAQAPANPLTGCNESSIFSANIGNNPEICAPAYDESGAVSAAAGVISSYNSGYGGYSYDVAFDWRIYT